MITYGGVGARLIYKHFKTTMGRVNRGLVQAKTAAIQQQLNHLKYSVVKQTVVGRSMHFPAVWSL